MKLIEKQKQERRDHILMCAVDLIRAEGLESFSMRELARRAELTVPTIYNLIGSRDSVLYAILESSIARLGKIFEEIKIEDPIDRTFALLERGCAENAADAALRRPLFNAILNRVDPLRAPPVIRRTLEVYEQIFIDGAQKGLFLDADLAHVMAGEAYLIYIQALRLWAWGLYDNEEFRNQTLCGAAVCLLAVATDTARPRLQVKLQELAPDLKNAYPHVYQIKAPTPTPVMTE